MKIIRAAEMGMCFGVRDAMQITATVPDASQVTIHGELVHNPHVIERLSQAGFEQSPEAGRERPIDTPIVLITAHGISEVERVRLQSEDKQLIDTTCPLVRQVHDAAQQLQREGRHVIVVGKPDHVEVRGIVEDLHSYNVVRCGDEVTCYPSRRLGVVSQTTTPPDVVTDVCSHLQLHNPLADIRMIDTVCRPTKQRQRAMLELLQRVDSVVVVGGHNSNNTGRLVELCHQHLTPAVHVEGPEELDPAWFDDVETVGLTAGTSTLDETVDAVHLAIQQIGWSRREQPKETAHED